MDIKLKCACGAVKGIAIDVTPDNGNLVVCCCNDCQAFANYLEHDDNIVDEFGGTKIYQTSQSQVKINKGHEHVRRLRLSPKGLNRWYTECCKTPIGNTVSAGIPLIGIISNFISNNDDLDSKDLDNTLDSALDIKLGPVLAYVQTQHARGTPDYPNPAKGFPIGITFRMIRKMLVWKIRGMNKPSAFFDQDGKAVVKAKILSELPQ